MIEWYLLLQAPGDVCILLHFQPFNSYAGVMCSPCIGSPVGALGVVDSHGWLNEGERDDMLLKIFLARHTKIAPALSHQHAPQIHLPSIQRVLDMREFINAT